MIHKNNNIKKVKVTQRCGNYTPHYEVWYNFTPQRPHLRCRWGVKPIPTHFARIFPQKKVNKNNQSKISPSSEIGLNQPLISL